MYELMKHYCTFLTLLKKVSEKITKKNVRLIRKLFRPKNMSNEVKMLQRCSIGNFQTLKWLWKLLLWSLWVYMLVIWTYCCLLWRKFTPMILINSLKLSGNSFRSLDFFTKSTIFHQNHSLFTVHRISKIKICKTEPILIWRHESNWNVCKFSFVYFIISSFFSVTAGPRIVLTNRV